MSEDDKKSYKSTIITLESEIKSILKLDPNIRVRLYLFNIDSRSYSCKVKIKNRIF